MIPNQYQQTHFNGGFNLFQERYAEFAEFIVTDLQPKAVRQRWLELPESVRQEFAEEERQLHDQKQQHFSTQNVLTPSPMHQLLILTTTMMKNPTTGVPQHYPKRNVRVTYAYKDENESRKNDHEDHQLKSSKQVSMEPCRFDTFESARVFRHGGVTERQSAIELHHNRNPRIKTTFSDEMKAYLLSYRKEDGLSPSLEVIRQLSDQTGYSITSLKNFYKNKRQQERAIMRNS